jgi:hypothetical protein
MEKVNKNFSGIYYHGKPDLKDNIIKYLLVIFSSFVSLFGCMQIFLKVLFLYSNVVVLLLTEAQVWNLLCYLSTILIAEQNFL